MTINIKSTGGGSLTIESGVRSTDDTFEFPNEPTQLLGRSDILKPLAVFEGTPVGGIVESGSNSNGEWVRYADGTQICAMNVTGNSPGGYIPNTDYIYIYPISFISTPRGGGIVGGGLASVGMIHYLASISASSITVRTTNNFTGSANVSLRFNITGRWY